MLDDSAEAVAEPDHAEAWREWLRLSDVLAMSQISYRITTLSAEEADGRTGGSSEKSPADGGEAPELPNGWAEVDLSFTEPIVIELARLLADAGVPPAEGGAEIDGGWMVELAWPEAKVVVVLDVMPEADLAGIRASGWHVVVAEGDVGALWHETVTCRSWEVPT